MGAGDPVTTPIGQKRVKFSLDQRIASIVDTTLEREGVTAMDLDYFERWLAMYQQVLIEMAGVPNS